MDPGAVGRAPCTARTRRFALPRDRLPNAQKTPLKPHLKEQWVKEQWVIPLSENVVFVCQMETVLDLYQEPYDSSRPVVCFDEKPCQLLAHARKPLPMRPATNEAPARPAREDYE